MQNFICITKVKNYLGGQKR